MDVFYIFFRPVADAIKRNKRQRRTKQPSYTINPDNMWSKGFLYTFWILGILLCFVGWGLSGIAFSVNSHIKPYENHATKVALLVDASVWLAWSTISFGLIITEMIMFAGKKDLRPLFAVISTSIRSVLWLILFVIAIRNAVVAAIAAFTVLILGVFFVIFFIPLIYSVVIYRRQRKGVYAPVEVESAATHGTRLQSVIEISNYQAYRQPQSVHSITSVPSIPAQVARPNAYEPLRPGFAGTTSPSLEEESPFHDRNLASELSAAETEYASETRHPSPMTFDAYRAPMPVELVGSPPPASSVYTQAEPEKRV